MNAERHNPELSSATRKRLFILEKLKEQWDLSGNSVGPHKFGWQRYDKWIAQAGIDDAGQLTVLLQGLERDGLVENARWINPAR